MSTIAKSTSVPRTYRITSVDGLRHIHSTTSILKVTVGPLPVVEEFLKQERSGIGYMAYVGEGPVSYIGHGCGERRVGDKVQEAWASVQRLYLIYSSYGEACLKDLAEDMEALLIDLADTNGVPLANGVKPAVPQSSEMVELASILKGFMREAGYPHLEQPHPANAVNAFCVFRAIERGAFVVPEGTVLKKLVCDDYEAQGFDLPNDRFCVLPDAHYSYRDKGLSGDNQQRRRDFEQDGSIQKLPGFDDRGQVVKGYNFITAPIAAKILTGLHNCKDVWQPVATVVAGEFK